jgi:long-chain-alcohol oxidase
LGGAAMTSRRYDVVIVGSGAGGGTVAQALVPLAQAGRRVLVLEQGPRLRDEEFTGGELDMAPQLYRDRGGFLTAEGTMTLAFAEAYGGSTLVYTGTSLTAPERVIRRWAVPGLEHDDLVRRSERYLVENNVHLLSDEAINDNNRLFFDGGRRAGYRVEQFPVNLKGCRGSSLCNLGCPNQAKQGTNRVQLPAAERGGVEIVTRARVLRITPERALVVRVMERPPGGKGLDSEWASGDHQVEARVIVLAGGAIGSPALLLRSALRGLPDRIGLGFTCHPALILVAVHERPITNDVGHPKSYIIDRAAEDGYVLETCMYFPFTTAKAVTGFGKSHSAVLHAFPRLQQILALAVDRASPGNRVAVDREGNPVVHYRFTSDTVERLVRANQAAARIFFSAGAIQVHAPFADPPLLERTDAAHIDTRIGSIHWKPAKQAVSAGHLMGGCAMGPGPADSVTDAWGRVHGFPWLRVADAALFPDSLEINPYVTIMALADRVAEGLLHDAPGLLG